MNKRHVLVKFNYIELNQIRLSPTILINSISGAEHTIRTETMKLDHNSANPQNIFHQDIDTRISSNFINGERYICQHTLSISFAFLRHLNTHFLQVNNYIMPLVKLFQ